MSASAHQTHCAALITSSLTAYRNSVGPSNSWKNWPNLETPIKPVGGSSRSPVVVRRIVKLSPSWSSGRTLPVNKEALASTTPSSARGGPTQDVVVVSSSSPRAWMPNQVTPQEALGRPMNTVKKVSSPRSSHSNRISPITTPVGSPTEKRASMSPRSTATPRSKPTSPIPATGSPRSPHRAIDSRGMDALSPSRSNRGGSDVEEGLLLNNKYPELTQRMSRETNLFWIEKALVVIDCLQIYGLMWCISQQWPWPLYWLSFTYYLNFFNFDMFSLHTGSPDHRMIHFMRGYLTYALLFVLLPGTVVFVIYVLKRRSKISFRRMAHLMRAIDVLSYVLLVPVGLAVGRLPSCTSSGVMMYDHSVECNSAGHILVTMLCLGGYLAYYLPYLWEAGRRIHKGILYDRPQDHETYIQGVELETMLGLSKEWMHAHMWLFASFHRRHALYWVVTMYAKLALVFVFMLSHLNVIEAQSFLYWLVVCLWTFYNTLTAPFRCRSTKVYALICWWTLWVVALFGMLTGTQTKSAFVVASTQTILLIFFASCGLFCIMVATGVLLYHERTKPMNKREEWPVNKTYRRLVADSEALEWVAAMKEAHAAMMECRLRPPELAPVHELEAHMSSIHQCWIYARKRGSILENLLRLTLDELARVHRMFRPLSILPGKDNRTLNTVNKFAEVIQNRTRTQALMNPKKRHLLFKLLALRLWVGKRTVAMTNNIEDALKGQTEGDDGQKPWESIVALVTCTDARVQRELLDRFQDLPFLLVKTEQLLGAPDPTKRDEIQTCRSAWKKLIRHWESSFEAQFHHKPTLDDKESKRQWYAAYKALSVQYKVS